MSSSPIRTERLSLRAPDDTDIEFLIELLNEPAFIRFIADRGVRTREQASAYLHGHLLPHFHAHGFGAYVAVRSSDGERLGLCTLIRRDSLPDADIGFAFLSRATGQGYAFEGTRALLDHARRALGITRVVAIANQDNERSIRLLAQLGLTDQGLVILDGETEPLRLFATDS